MREQACQAQPGGNCPVLALRFQLDLVFQVHMIDYLHFCTMAEELTAYAIPRGIVTKLSSCGVSAMLEPKSLRVSHLYCLYKPRSSRTM